MARRLFSLNVRAGKKRITRGMPVYRGATRLAAPLFQQDRFPANSARERARSAVFPAVSARRKPPLAANHRQTHRAEPAGLSYALHARKIALASLFAPGAPVSRDAATLQARSRGRRSRTRPQTVVCRIWGSKQGLTTAVAAVRGEPRSPRHSDDRVL